MYVVVEEDKVYACLFTRTTTTMSPLQGLGEVVRFVKAPKSVVITTMSQRAFSEWGARIVFAAAALSAGVLMTGIPVSCVTENPSYASHCAARGLYTIPDVELVSSQKLQDAPPGMAAITQAMRNNGATFDKRSHDDYTLQYCVLLGLAVVLFMPTNINKHFEKGFLRDIVESSKVGGLIDEKELVCRVLNTFSIHDWEVSMFAIRSFILDIANPGLLAGALWFYHRKINDSFLWYGYEEAHYQKHGITTNGHKVSPRDLYHPLQAACEYKIVGKSGTLQIQDFICTLTQNKLLGIVFLIVWCLLAFIIFISAMQLLWNFLFATSFWRKFYMTLLFRNKRIGQRLGKHLGWAEAVVLMRLTMNLGGDTNNQLARILSKARAREDDLDYIECHFHMQFGKVYRVREEDRNKNTLTDFGVGSEPW